MVSSQDEWIARRERCRLHFAPTYSSWPNQVEHWLGLISRRAIKRVSSRNVTGLASKINAFTQGHDVSAKPFIWAATAQSIIDKVERLSTCISGTSR